MPTCTEITLILDNASSHKWNEDEELSNVVYIYIYFLPPNNTAYLQPCDAGIIWSFKSHYRKLLCINRIETVNSARANRTQPSNFTLLDAIQTVA